MGNTCLIKYEQPNGEIFRLSMLHRLSQVLGCSDVTLEQHTARFYIEQQQLVSKDMQVLEMHRRQLEMVETRLAALVAEFGPELETLTNQMNKGSRCDNQISAIKFKRMNAELNQYQRLRRNHEIDIARVILNSGRRKALHMMRFSRKQESVLYGTTNVKNLEKEAKRLFIEQEREMQELETAKAANDMKDEKDTEMLHLFLEQGSDESFLDAEEDDDIILTGCRSDALELQQAIKTIQLPSPNPRLLVAPQSPKTRTFEGEVYSDMF